MLPPCARSDLKRLLRSGSDAALWEPPPDDGTNAITIAMVGEFPGHPPIATVVLRLAELAVTDELIVVYGSDHPETGAHRVVAALRRLLPRFTVVPLYVAPTDESHRCDTALVDGLLNDGSLPVVLAPAVIAPKVAADLFHHLRADRVLEVLPS
jgi:MFS transporter, NNP family, nitrate/nitrite transporter